jgi:hypothetical protein
MTGDRYYLPNGAWVDFFPDCVVIGIGKERSGIKLDEKSVRALFKLLADRGGK